MFGDEDDTMDYVLAWVMALYFKNIVELNADELVLNKAAGPITKEAKLNYTPPVRELVERADLDTTIEAFSLDNCVLYTIIDVDYLVDSFYRGELDTEYLMENIELFDVVLREDGIAEKLLARSMDAQSSEFSVVRAVAEEATTRNIVADAWNCVSGCATTVAGWFGVSCPGGSDLKISGGITAALKTNGRIQTNHALPNPGLSAKTVRSIHMMLSSCLDKAVNERLIPSNPAHGCNIPPKEKREMKIIPPEQIGRFLQEADKAGYLAMFYLELTSGLRRGELLALLWSDVDAKTNTISVSKQVIRVNGELKVLPPKTKNAVRKIVLPRQAIDLLIAEHERHPDNPLLFPSPKTGRHFDPPAVARKLKTLLKRAEIDEIRFHDLRHTFATLSLQNGVDVKTLSHTLGHYSAGFTLDTYTHVTTQMQEDAAKKIGGFMAKI